VISPREYDRRAEGFRKMLAMPPDAGTNTTLITHQRNLVAALGKDWQDVKQGEASNLPPRGLVLEVASGSGEHAAYFAKRLPTLLWQPTDPDPRALASIAAHRTAADTPNLLSPLWLDAMSEQWPVQRADALVCINMIHITLWAACKGLMTGAERTLRSGSVLYLYGPYQINGRYTAQSNQEFDAWLRTQNAEWGVRDIAEVTKVGAASPIFPGRDRINGS
jgi:Protein of unknown function (DUF938)